MACWTLSSPPPLEDLLGDELDFELCLLDVEKEQPLSKRVHERSNDAAISNVFFIFNPL